MLDEKIILDIFQEVGKYLNRVGFFASLEELQSRYDDALFLGRRMGFKQGE